MLWILGGLSGRLSLARPSKASPRPSKALPRPSKELPKAAPRPSKASPRPSKAPLRPSKRLPKAAPRPSKAFLRPSKAHPTKVPTKAQPLALDLSGCSVLIVLVRRPLKSCLSKRFSKSSPLVFPIGDSSL